MGIFQTKPSMVEAEQLPDVYSEGRLHEIIDWLSKDSTYLSSTYSDKVISIHLTTEILIVPFGIWLVKLGDGRYGLYDDEEFNARYSWIGPKEHYDAPYMVN